MIKTGREAGSLEKEEVKVLTPRRLRKYWLTKVSHQLAASGPLGVLVVPGVVIGLYGTLGMVSGGKIPWHLGMHLQISKG